MVKEDKSPENQIEQKEKRYNHLTMEIGQLYLNYRNTKEEHLMNLIDEKVNEIRKLESELKVINTRTGLE